MSAGSLADGFVELQLKVDAMVAQGQQVIAETTKIAKAAEAAWGVTQKNIIAENQKVFKIQKELERKTTEGIIRQRREYVKLGDEWRRSMGYDAAGGMSTGRGAMLAGYASRGMSIASSTAAAGVALTFAAAAAAGSTTMDTLTGSLKMLSLAAGAKTQSSVIGLSKNIQQFAHFIDKLDPTHIYAALGLVTGAGIGYRNSPATMMGKARGISAGAGIGIGAGLFMAGHETIGGTLTGASIAAAAGMGPVGMVGMAGAGAIVGEIKKLWDQKATLEEKSAKKILASPEGIEGALKKAGEWQKIADANFDLESGKLAAGLKLAANKAQEMKESQDEAFKTAGLNMPLTMSSLASAYDAGNIAMMGTSPLDISNRMREWKLNMEATRSRTSVDPNFVGPPQGN